MKGFFLCGDNGVMNTLTNRLPFTANFHFLRACNFRCRYCYATFADSIDSDPRGLLSHDQLIAVVRQLARRFTKLTFAGGEPTLYRRLPELLAAAKAEGALVNLVTNGSRLDPARLASFAGSLDFLTLSADSADAATMAAIGRADAAGRALPADHYLSLAVAARTVGIGLKLNTVVTTLNTKDDMAAFVRALAPSRWKLLQAAPVAGQNDAFIATLSPAREDFDGYVARHAAALVDTAIRLVPEPIEVIRGSYVMVDPLGRFFDSATGRHRYSRPLLDVGVDVARGDVAFDEAKFSARGGTADWAATSTLFQA
jgi:radical S-adenosyl methionine domain-containing protein 2